MDHQFTRQQFLDQLLLFRELMGSKSFWDKPENIREKAVKGFSFVYFNADLSLPSDASLFEGTLLEYSKRETYMFLRPAAKAT